MHHCGILVPSLRSPQGRQREAEQQEQKRPGLFASQEAEDPEFRSSFGWVSLHRQTVCSGDTVKYSKNKVFRPNNTAKQKASAMLAKDRHQSSSSLLLLQTDAESSEEKSCPPAHTLANRSAISLSFLFPQLDLSETQENSTLFQDRPALCSSKKSPMK